MSTQIAVVKSSNDLVLSSENRGALVEISGMMSQAMGAVPDWLNGNQGGCFAIAMQAASWNMNPFIVAQKSLQIKGKIGYEAQLINAVATASGAIRGRFKYDFVGDWSTKSGAGGRVGAIIAGESEITWGHVHYFSDIQVKNSPLWKSNPQQQLGYLLVKNWVRMYAPDALLGVYSQDELVGISENTTPTIVVESQQVVAVRKSVAECTNAEYFSQLVAWVDTFTDSDEKAVCVGILDTIRDKYDVIDEPVAVVESVVEPVASSEWANVKDVPF